MLRPAVPADLRCLAAIRDASGADALSDPALVADAELRRLVGAGAVAVWEEDGEIAGFGAADSAAIHLLVAAGARGNQQMDLSLIHISEPTRQAEISYAV